MSTDRTESKGPIDSRAILGGKYCFFFTLRILTPQKWLFWTQTPAIQVQTLPLEGPRILRATDFFRTENRESNLPVGISPATLLPAKWLGTSISLTLGTIHDYPLPRWHGFESMIFRRDPMGRFQEVVFFVFIQSS